MRKLATKLLHLIRGKPYPGVEPTAKRVAMARLNDCAPMPNPGEPKRVVKLGPGGTRYIKFE